MKLPGVPEIPDCSAVLAAAEKLMATTTVELPKLVSHIGRIADAMEAQPAQDPPDRSWVR